MLSNFFCFLNIIFIVSQGRQQFISMTRFYFSMEVNGNINAIFNHLRRFYYYSNFIFCALYKKFAANFISFSENSLCLLGVNIKQLHQNAITICYIKMSIKIYSDSSNWRM